jgi:hypothetical protein
MDDVPQPSVNESTESYLELPTIAEEVTREALSGMPGMTMRKGTDDEDAGNQQIGGGLKTDSVGLIDGKPVLGIQTTITTDSRVQLQKTQEMIDRPFIRLRDGSMKQADTSIPRAVVALEPRLVREYAKDRDLSKHPELSRQIFDRLIIVLGKLEGMTKNPKEKSLAASLQKVCKLHRASL